MWVCIFASCVWMPDLLPPVGRGSPFAPFSGKLPEGTLSPLPAHLLARTKRTLQTKTSSPVIGNGRRLAPTEAQSGRGGAVPRSWSPPSTRDEACLWGAGGRRGLLPSAPGRRRRACVCVRCGVRVCVSHANPPSPNRPPQQFAIPYKFGNRFLKNSMTHNGDGAGEGSGTGAPNLRVTDCKNLGRGGGGAGPHFTKVHRSALGRRGPRAGRGIPGPGRAARLSQNLLA